MKRGKPLERRTPLKPGKPLVAKKPLSTSQTQLVRHSTLKAGTMPMKRSRSTKAPTKVEVLRFDALRKIGCLACLHNLANDMPITGMAVEIHHVLSGGRRIGHEATIPLCVFHHQADKWPDPAMGYKQASALYEPTLARDARRFHDFYGLELDLITLANRMMKECGNPAA